MHLRKGPVLVPNPETLTAASGGVLPADERDNYPAVLAWFSFMNVLPQPYRGTSLIRKRTPLGPYRRPMLRVLGGVLGGWAFSCK